MLRLIVFLLGCSLLSVHSAQGIVRPIDYTKRADRIGNMRFNPGTWQAPMAMNVRDHTMQLQQWQTQFSSIGQRRAAIAMEGRTQNVMQPDSRSPELKDMPRHRFNRSEVQSPESGPFSVDRRVQRFEGASESFMTAMQHDAIADARDRELSLRDINRFQFRRSREDAPPPVQRVGGIGPVEIR